MKFKTGYTLKDREGEEKIIREFVWLPLSFGEAKEKIWLEVADVVYQVKKVDIGAHFSDFRWKWRTDRFPTIEDYKELPFEKPFDDGYDMFEKIIRNPLTWLILDFVAILIVVWGSKNAATAFLSLKLIQCITLVMFRDRSNEV